MIGCWNEHKCKNGSLGSFVDGWMDIGADGDGGDNAHYDDDDDEDNDDDSHNAEKTVNQVLTIMTARR